MASSENDTPSLTRDITGRAIFIGACLSLVIAVATPYSVNVIHGSTMALDFTTPAAIFLFFVVTLVNVCLWASRRVWALSPGELVTIYVMMIVACAIPTMGLTSYLLPIIVTPAYYASPENRWGEMVVPYVPSWLAPQDPDAIRWFFEGLPSGESIPWAAWAVPLFFWSLFLLTLYFVMLCLAVIIRKQWADRERLVYPLVHLPQDMVQQEEQRCPSASFLTNRLMWIGFAIPFLLGSLNALHFYFHLVPHIETVKYLSIFRRALRLIFRISFPMIGFSYLLHLDVAFSLWSFSLLTTIERGIFTMLGIEPSIRLDPYSQTGGGPLLTHQSTGAIFMLVLLGLWHQRQHLWDVIRKATSGAPDVDDSGEVISYRTAFWGTVLGLIFMTLWLWQAGIPLWAASAFMVALVVLFLGVTRVVAEGGFATTRIPMIPSTLVVTGFGSHVLGPAGLVGFGLTYTFAADVRTMVLVSCANGLKLAELTKRKRRLAMAIMLAVVVSLVGSVWMTLKLGYTYGGANANRWFFVSGAQCPFHFAAARMNNPSGPSPQAWLFLGIGATTMGLLTVLHHHFVWWPLHPLGFAFGTVWLTNQIWFSVFLAWLVKFFVLKLGGMDLFRRTRPLFLGLILGQFACSGVWLVIDFFTGAVGNRLFWI